MATSMITFQGNVVSRKKLRTYTKLYRQKRTLLRYVNGLGYSLKPYETVLMEDTSINARDMIRAFDAFVNALKEDMQQSLIAPFWQNQIPGANPEILKHRDDAFQSMQRRLGRISIDPAVWMRGLYRSVPTDKPSQYLLIEYIQVMQKTLRSVKEIVAPISSSISQARVFGINIGRVMVPTSIKISPCHPYMTALRNMETTENVKLIFMNMANLACRPTEYFLSIQNWADGSLRLNHEEMQTTSTEFRTPLENFPRMFSNDPLAVELGLQPGEGIRGTLDEQRIIGAYFKKPFWAVVVPGYYQDKTYKPKS